MQDKSIPSYNRLTTNDAQIKEIIALSEYISRWKQEVDEYIVHDTSDKSFKDTWRTTGTLEQFCEDVVADLDAVVGQVYLGQLECSGLPEGMASGEAEVKVTQGLSDKLLVITMTSTNLSPYHWEQSYYNGNLYGWKTWVLEDVMYYKDIYIGSGATYSDVMIEDNHIDKLMKGKIVPIVSTDDYLWVILPSNYDPNVLMNGLYVPITLDSTVTVGDITYNVMKSDQGYTGTYNIFLL